MIPTSGRLAGRALLLGAALAGFGCSRDGARGPAIASNWPDPERAALASEFRAWAEAHPEAVRGPIGIHWIPLSREDDLAGIVRRRRGVDVVLGGPSSWFSEMARDGLLVPIDPGDPLPWRVARRSSIGLATHTPSAGESISPSERGRGVTFDDPRRDPIALAWAKRELRSKGWAEGYAGLVRAAGHPRRIGRAAGAALAAVERGEAGSTPSLVPGGPDAEWVDGVAIVRGGPHSDDARAFLTFLAETGRAELPPGGPEDNPEADALLADLLGATLVDAQDELWDAWDTLDRGENPQRAPWMAEAPPWPPASVEKILRQAPSSELLDTLARQIAPDADVRAWLTRSWLLPTRRIDGEWLGELASAAEGRLAREPRVRAWLRAEWREWARQRYRRVARPADPDDPFGPPPLRADASPAGADRP